MNHITASIKKARIAYINIGENKLLVMIGTAPTGNISVISIHETSRKKRKFQEKEDT
ncbi:15742_t:CDS:1, partial [Entrophospora sp. SA101]